MCGLTLLPILLVVFLCTSSLNLFKDFNSLDDILRLIGLQ